MSQAQLALPGVVAESSAEWVWIEETGEEIGVSGFVHETEESEGLVRIRVRHGARAGA